MKVKQMVRRCLPVMAVLGLGACQLVQYQPLQTLNAVDTQTGYRLERAAEQQRASKDDVMVAVLFSGGGTRAAALGYGVLEELYKQQVYIGGRKKPLAQSIDLVYGVSGGSVLAAYYALHGKDTIPSFEKRFLKQNFQRLVTKQVFSMANLPRLTSPEFGRSDLLQEQFENTLFGKATFGDLATRRKGPFAVISATDMSQGRRLDFTQEYFDMMCLNLSDLPIARAVAASSSVPLVFSPITLNNNGGNCHYVLPDQISRAISGQEGEDEGLRRRENRRDFALQLQAYTNSRERPFIHLLDGGLTDNLGLRSLMSQAEIYPSSMLQQRMNDQRVNKVVVISVNARNQIDSMIDQSPNVPGMAAVADAVINIPIDRYSQASLNNFRRIVDDWNAGRKDNPGRADLYFVSLNLDDLPPSQLRKNVLNVPTSFYLPTTSVNDLQEAARVLLANSKEYKRLLDDLSSPRVEGQAVNRPLWFVGEGPQQPAAEGESTPKSGDLYGDQPLLVH